jgi:outer membrane protein OmpA-like peptidoglycan-associated protein
MKMRALKRKIPIALLGAASLCFGLVMTSTHASVNQPRQPADTADTASFNGPAHLVLHGIRFDRASDQLGAGSRAELDDAAEILKSDPNTLVFVGSNDSSAACGISPAEAKTIANYMETRGVPPDRIRVCQENNLQSPNHG